jgi:CRISPR/Cas system-associated exonuclease Cas4 (RecB family)
MRNLTEAILQKKAEKIKRYPCASNRASSIGYSVEILGGCLRRGVFERTRWQEKEMHDAKTQCIFDEGHNQEAVVLRDLAEAGIDIIEQQTPFEMKAQQLTGHVDGKYVEDGVAYPIEIKSMHPAIFDSVHCFDDLRKKPWLRSYMCQITLYMLMQGVDKGIFLLKNKSSGELKQITVDLDYELGEACLKTAEKINEHIKANTEPDKISDIQVCKDCPFKLICCPGVKFGTELRIVDDPLFESRVEKCLSLKDQANEYDKIYSVIRDESKAQAGETGNLNIVVGKYRLTGSKDSRGSFRLKIGEP